MKVTTIRYKIAPDRINENIQLVRAVFAALNESAPSGLQYASMCGEDGAFVHVVCTDSDADAEALTSLPAFQQFRAGLKERQIEASEFTAYDVVGNYGVF